MTKYLTCPNCGANITNTQNCEYCGSLLVRFVDKGIDLSKTKYIDKSKISNKILKALQVDLKMQEHTTQSVVVDLYKRISDNAYIYIGCVLRSGFALFADGTKISSNRSNGLCVVFTFSDATFADINYNKKFKQLDCFSLFDARSHTNKDGHRQREFFIDFGSDAEGAALLLSDVISNVYGVSEENLECVVNEGNDAIERSRKKMSTTNRPKPTSPPMTAKDLLILSVLTVLSLIFVCIGVWTLHSDSGILNSIMGILTIVFFGFCFFRFVYIFFSQEKDSRNV